MWCMRIFNVIRDRKKKCRALPNPSYATPPWVDFPHPMKVMGWGWVLYDLYRMYILKILLDIYLNYSYIYLIFSTHILVIIFFKKKIHYCHLKNTCLSFSLSTLGLTISRMFYLHLINIGTISLGLVKHLQLTKLLPLAGIPYLEER